MPLPPIGTTVPVYVTRPTADDLVMTYSLNLYASMILFLLIVVNGLVWSIIGLYEAWRVIF